MNNMRDSAVMTLLQKWVNRSLVFAILGECSLLESNCEDKRTNWDATGGALGMTPYCWPDSARETGV